MQVVDNTTQEPASIEPQNTKTEPNESTIPCLINDLAPMSITPQALTLNEAITCRIVELQIMWDETFIPIGVQDSMLHQLFGSLQQEPKVFEHGMIDYSELFLGRLLTIVGPQWQGDIGGGVVAPASWKQLRVFYKSLGLVETQRFRLCVGSTEVSHVP